MRRHPTPFQIRTLWNAATGVAITILGLLLVLIIWLMGKVLGFLQPVIVPLAVAGIIAYLLDPVVRWFQKRGLSRIRAVVATFGSFLAAGALLTAITIPMVGNQINAFRSNKPGTQEASSTPAQESSEEKSNTPFDQRIVDALVDIRTRTPWTRPVIDSVLAPPTDELPAPERATQGEEISDRLDTYAEELDDQPDQKPEHGIRFRETSLWSQVKALNDDAVHWIKGGTGKILNFLGLVLGFVMVPIYLYYFLKDSSAIREHWHEYVPLKASRFKTEVIETLTEINGYMISFFRGQVLVAFIDGLLIGVALTAFRLPLGLLIGIMMAIVGIIPFVGNILTLIPACLIAWFHYSDPNHASIVGSNPWANVAAVCAIFFIAQQINSMVTAPKIVGDSVGLHPMTVIFSMIFWSLILGGFVGALLAVPLTASIKVLFRRYIWERKIKEQSAESEVVAPDEPLTEPAS
ncbi:putative PurR-regulated permease PerM [Haloferula luteola]|uniref:Putative PurR-regulated permease PerM n=1 Tax=Haloferula luteola TaxID=595692 RepID=A0A840UV28_9BACT|nr:AI-2E family transporter [Haloferula luteola]MBB5350047.1 putative PurR-regulated permease PerM [Haloferula luteola]